MAVVVMLGGVVGNRKVETTAQRKQQAFDKDVFDQAEEGAAQYLDAKRLPNSDFRMIHVK